MRACDLYFCIGRLLFLLLFGVLTQCCLESDITHLDAFTHHRRSTMYQLKSNQIKPTINNNYILYGIFCESSMRAHEHSRIEMKRNWLQSSAVMCLNRFSKIPICTWISKGKIVKWMHICRSVEKYPMPTRKLYSRDALYWFIANVIQKWKYYSAISPPEKRREDETLIAGIINLIKTTHFTRQWMNEIPKLHTENRFYFKNLTT